MKKVLMIILILLLCVVWFAVGFRAGKIQEITGSFPSISAFFTNDEVEIEDDIEIEEETSNETVKADVIVTDEIIEEEKTTKSVESKNEAKTTQNFNQKYYLVSESTSSKSVININSTCQISLENSIILEGTYEITKDDKVVIEIKNAYKEDEGRVLVGVSGFMMFDKQSDNTIKLIGLDIQDNDNVTKEMINASGIKVGNVYTLE